MLKMKNPNLVQCVPKLDISDSVIERTHLQCLLSLLKLQQERNQEIRSAVIGCNTSDSEDH
jgi:hypothetical protein